MSQIDTDASSNAPETAPVAPETPPPSGDQTYIGTGRRKTAVARVRVSRGSGKFEVNGRPVETYFHEVRDQNDVLAPLVVAGGVRAHWDVKVRASGGGMTGQAGALKLGLSRALLKAYPQHEQALRDAGFLTRDAREVERKKYGHRKARRRFQFSKR